VRVEGTSKLDEMIVMEKYLVDDHNLTPMITEDTFKPILTGGRFEED
jgi:hypothetical protein